jgi:hypothetical protein
MQKLQHTLQTLFLFILFVGSVYASVSTPISIDLNSTVDGILASDSESSPVTSNPADDYVFTLTETKDIVIDLDADFSYGMYLLNSCGCVIDTATKYDEVDNKIVASLLPGTYIIDITTKYKGQDGGPFSLSLNENHIDSKPIDIDSLIEDEWTSLSGFSPRSKKHTNYYTFTVSEKTDVLIDLQSNMPLLYLLDSNNTVIANTPNNLVYDTQHAKIVKTLSPGTYTIDATSGRYGSDIKSYTLGFKTNLIESSEIALNSVVHDSWRLSSGTSPRSKNYTQYYTFTLDEDKDIAIVMDTNIDYAKIYLIDSNNTVLAESNNRKFIAMHLSAGSYTIDASSGNNQVGDFALSLRENIITNEPIIINSSVEVDLNSRSGISEYNGAYLNYYTFTVDEKKNLLIDLEGLNLSFYILDEDGNRISKYNRSVFYRRQAMDFEPGTYTIAVTQLYRREGHYHLSLSENIIKTATILLNSSVEDVLDDSDGISPYSNAYVKRYILTLDKETDIAVDLNMSNPDIIDKRVDILNENTGEKVTNIVYGSFPKLVKHLAAGTYFIDVTYGDMEKDKTSAFTLSLRENIIETKPILLNQLIAGRWTQESGLNEYGNHVNRYTFSLVQSDNVFITLHSDHSKSLVLRRNRIIDRASYIDENQDLLLAKVLDAGTYTIDVINSDQRNSDKVGDYTLLVQVNVDIPQPVKHSVVDSVGAYSATLTWEKGDDTVGYRIYIDDKLVAEVPVDENAFVVNGLQPETTHRYRIVAYNSVGESTPVSGEFTTQKDDYGWMIPIHHLILN